MYASRLLAVHDTRRRDDLRGLGRTASAGNLVNGWSHIKSRARKSRDDARGDMLQGTRVRRGWTGGVERNPACLHGGRVARTGPLAPRASRRRARGRVRGRRRRLRLCPSLGRRGRRRIAAGRAVLLELLQARRGVKKPPVVLAATHDGELVELTSGTFDAYHFGDSIGPDGLMFDHRLQRGPASTRNAIALLRLHGAPETLLVQADSCSNARSTARHHTRRSLA
jgi:hypothetical protein